MRPCLLILSILVAAGVLLFMDYWGLGGVEKTVVFSAFVVVYGCGLYGGPTLEDLVEDARRRREGRSQ